MTDCGCRYNVCDDSCTIDPADQCVDCRSRSEVAEERLRAVLDNELDIYVYNHAGGKRVQRIVPADPYRKDKTR